MEGVCLEDMVSEERAESLAGQNLKSQLHPTLAGRNLPLWSLRHFSEYLKEGSARRLGCSSFLPLYTSVSWQEHYRMTARKGMLTVAYQPWPWPWYEAFPLFDFSSSCDTPKAQWSSPVCKTNHKHLLFQGGIRTTLLTFPYACPRQWAGGRSVSPSTEVHALHLRAGVLLSQARSPVSLSLLANVTPVIREHAAGWQCCRDLLGSSHWTLDH